MNGKDKSAMSFLAEDHALFMSKPEGSREWRCRNCLNMTSETEQERKDTLLCNRCFKERADRAKEQEEAQSEVKGLSCPDWFENMEYGSDGFGQMNTKRRCPHIIGCRDDARWYKKGGSNGDG
jgi:hypothetical protein